jgi:hypothetical protein
MAHGRCSKDLNVCANSVFCNVDMPLSPGSSLSAFIATPIFGDWEIATHCKGQCTSIVVNNPQMHREIILKRAEIHQPGVYTRADLLSVVHTRYPDADFLPSDTAYMVIYTDDGTPKMESCFDAFATHTCITPVDKKLLLTHVGVQACLDKHAAAEDLAICVRSIDKPGMDKSSMHIKIRLTCNTIPLMMEGLDSSSDEEDMPEPTPRPGRLQGYLSWGPWSNQYVRNAISRCV